MSLIDKLKDTHWPIEVETHKELLKCMSPEDCSRLVGHQSVYDLPGKIHRIRFKSLSVPEKRKADIFTIGEVKQLPGHWPMRRGRLKTTIFHMPSENYQKFFKDQEPYYEFSTGFAVEFEVMEDVIKIMKAVKEFMSEI